MSTPNDILDQTDFNPTDMVPGYELLASIGSGGFGVVYKARQLVLDRVVAVKLIRIDQEASPALVARFDAEAHILGKLNHPNIVQVYDYGRNNGRLFLAMEMLKGEDLDHRLLDQRRLSEGQAWAVARQTAAALAHAAQLGVVHRDIKPANLFLVIPPAGIGWPPDVPMVKVMDFGLALNTHALAEGDNRLTKANTAPGTPLYMAPEQHRKEANIDHRVDIYAFGATIFHAMMGRPPYPGPTLWDLVLQKLDHRLRFDPEVSPESVSLLLAMMDPDPEKRIASYDELIARIEQLPCMKDLRSAPISRQAILRPVGGFLRRRWRWISAASVLFGVGAGVSGGVWAGGANAPAWKPFAAEYVRAGDEESLLEPGSLWPWLPSNAGGTWHFEKDDEGATVLTGIGWIRRAFPAYENYRINISLAVHKAGEAEVHFGIPKMAPESGQRFVLRVTTTEGATFGTQVGEKGEFRALGNSVRYPNTTWFKDGSHRPYLGIRFERTEGRWRIWFNGSEVGSANEDDIPRSSELRLKAEDGRIRVEEVNLTELRKRQ